MLFQIPELFYMGFKQPEQKHSLNNGLKIIENILL